MSPASEPGHDPNDPAAAARKPADPDPDRAAGQEADRIETMNENLSEGYGGTADGGTPSSGRGTATDTARDVAKRHGERDR